MGQAPPNGALGCASRPDALASRHDALSRLFDERGNEIETAIGSRLGALSQLFDSQGRQVEESLATRLAAFEDIIVHQGGTLTANLTITGVLTVSTAENIKALAAQIDELEALLDAGDDAEPGDASSGKLFRCDLAR